MNKKYIAIVLALIIIVASTVGYLAYAEHFPETLMFLRHLHQQQP